MAFRENLILDFFWTYLEQLFWNNKTETSSSALKRFLDVVSRLWAISQSELIISYAAFVL